MCVEKIMKTSIKAILLALNCFDFKSAWKLLNFRKNNEFIACLNLLAKDNKDI